MKKQPAPLLGQRFLVFDVTNLLYKTFFAHKQEGDITVAGMAHHTAFVTLNKYYKLLKPHKVIMAFDRSSWRKGYTSSPECLSQRPYKGNRRQSMTPKEKAKYELFLKHLADFETMIRDHTSVICLAAPGLEADDLIGGVCQIYSLDDDNEVVIISSDKDMIQLLGNRGVRVIDPSTGKDRTLEEWDNDADLFLFEKCLRGDAGDNVMSAFPRVRSDRILRAYENEIEKINLMQSQWKAPPTEAYPEGREYVVKELYKENQLLMDLRKQPDDIQHLIVTTIIEARKNAGTFSYFHFMKFLGKFELKKIAEQAETFAEMLSR